MRVVWVLVAGLWFDRLLHGRRRPSVEADSDLPLDAEVLAIVPDPDRARTWRLLVQSADFADVPEGAVVPQRPVTFRV